MATVFLKTTSVTFAFRFKTCHAVKLLVRLLHNSDLRLATAIESHRDLEKNLAQLSSFNSRRLDSRSCLAQPLERMHLCAC